MTRLIQVGLLDPARAEAETDQLGQRMFQLSPHSYVTRVSNSKWEGRGGVGGD